MSPHLLSKTKSFQGRYSEVVVGLQFCQEVTGQGKCQFMKGLTLSAKEQNRLQTLNGVLERNWSIQEAAPLLEVSERQGWRLLAAYRQGARGLVPSIIGQRYICLCLVGLTNSFGNTNAVFRHQVLVHGNRARIPPNATPETIQQQVVALAQERYQGVNHTHLTELLVDRDGLI